MPRYLAKLKIRKAMRANKSSKPKARKDRRPASLDRRLLSIGLTTALALVLTVTLPFLDTRVMQGPPNRLVLVLLLVLFFGIIPLTVIYSIFCSIVIPFDQTIPWQARVLLVVVGYFAMILTYSGVYFSIAAHGDYNQAVVSNIHFEYLGATSASGVALGAIQTFQEQSSMRLSVRGDGRVAEDPFIQLCLAEAAAKVSAAHDRLLHNFAALMHLLRAGQEIPLTQRARVRWDAAQAVAWCVQAVDRLFEASGGRAIFVDHPIQRAFRDVHAIRAYAGNNTEKAAVLFGRAEFSLPPVDLRF